MSENAHAFVAWIPFFRSVLFASSTEIRKGFVVSSQGVILKILWHFTEVVILLTSCG